MKNHPVNSKHGHSNLVRALTRLLRPLVRLLLRHGVACDDFVDVVRKSYVSVAEQEFPPPGRKQSLTNIALVTGIHRHEVKRLMQESSDNAPPVPRHNRAARVINGWLTDPDFSTDGVARVLNIHTGFKKVVSRYSGDITPRPILDELLRVGAIKRVDNESLQLIVTAYVPHDSDADMLHIFGDCVADLITTASYNLEAESDTQRLQLSVVHDNLPDNVLANLESVSRDKSIAFLRDMNQFFETQDRDSNPNVQGSGRNRAGIGLYFFREELDE